MSDTPEIPLEATRAYYDGFAERYEARRDGNDPGGYHDLVDELEASFVERFGREHAVLEVGCGTGLVLERIGRFAASAKGVDLSPEMLRRAKERNLDVVLGSATELPFPDASFDVACSFKVLAHVEPIEKALAEMARVVRPGGYVLAEFYNPMSLRGLARRFGPAVATGANQDERSVYTRFDAPSRASALAPKGTFLVASRGVRIVTPAAALLRVPFLGQALKRTECALADSWLSTFGGFWIGAFFKQG